MNKKKNDVWNLVFSAFLVTAFLICASFFIGMINDSFTQDSVKRTLLTALIFVLFGLLLFYATSFSVHSGADGSAGSVCYHCISGSRLAVS